jgi:hypothetical protein
MAGRSSATLRTLAPAALARQIRRALKDGGSAEHASGVQWFFKDEIKSHGWYTAPLRRAARQWRSEILKDQDLHFLAQVADHLFSGSVLEEKIAAVFLLEKLDAQFGDREFRMFEAWLDRISSWADHDGLVHYLIAPNKIRLPLGEVKESLAPACRLRRLDPRRKGENVLPGNRQTLQHVAHRRR